MSKCLFVIILTGLFFVPIAILADSCPALSLQPTQSFLDRIFFDMSSYKPVVPPGWETVGYVPNLVVDKVKLMKVNLKGSIEDKDKLVTINEANCFYGTGENIEYHLLNKQTTNSDKTVNYFIAHTWEIKNGAFGDNSSIKLELTCEPPLDCIW